MSSSSLRPARRPGLAALLLALPGLAAGQSATPPSPTADWGYFLQAHPGTAHPQLLDSTLRFIRAATPADQQRLTVNQAGLLGFYLTWLALHPGERAGFGRALAAMPGPPAWRRVLRMLAEVPPPDSPLLRGPSPTHNDYLWGSYFASGRPALLDSVVAQVRYVVARPATAEQAACYYYTGTSAAWSLGRLCQQDSVVARHLRQPLVRQQLAAWNAQWQAARQAPHQAVPDSAGK